MIKAVIFDLDDLMVDHYGLHKKAEARALKTYGHFFKEVPLERRKQYVGSRVREVLSDLKNYFKLPVSFNEFYDCRMRFFLDLVKKRVIPRPGIFKKISLFEKMGLRMAVASSGTKEYIDICLDRLGVRDNFKVIVSGDDVKEGKPHPETYRVAIKKLGLKPEECLVLEDAEKGVESAKGAGAKCIGVVNPNTPKQDLSKADLVVGSLEEIDEKILERFK